MQAFTVSLLSVTSKFGGSNFITTIRLLFKFAYLLNGYASTVADVDLKKKPIKELRRQAGQQQEVFLTNHLQCVAHANGIGFCKELVLERKLKDLGCKFIVAVLIGV